MPISRAQIEDNWAVYSGGDQAVPPKSMTSRRFSAVTSAPTMDSLPIDMSHPAVRDYISLIRLQVLTPLSLLINIATVLVCTVLIKPGIAAVTKEYPTSISPSPFLIAIYVCVIYAGQIGYCFLLVLARKPETKVVFYSFNTDIANNTVDREHSLRA